MPRPASFRFSSTAAFASLALVALTAGLLGCKKNEPTAAPSAAPPANTAAATGPGAFGKGTIAGNVKFTGKAPELRAVTTPDPFCARQPIKEEDVMVGPGGGLKNVIVRVVKGTTGTYDAP